MLNLNTNLKFELLYSNHIFGKIDHIEIFKIYNITYVKFIFSILFIR